MKGKLFITLTVFLSITIINAVSAFGTFSGPTAFGTGVRLSSIAFGDIDNDGDLDLIVSGYNGGYRLDKYINNGVGSFTGPTAFGTGVYASSIVFGDIDNDGDLDLIVSGNNAGTPHLDKYLNSGSGTFTGPTAFGTSVGYSSIALGDIDNDGDLDLIVTGNNRLDKYINDGSGTFSGPTAFGTGIREGAITLGDIDNDGDLDLIVSGLDSVNNGRLDKYINNGSGSFSGPTNFGTGVRASSVAFGDIDNDGDLDLIVTGDSSSGYRLDKYINNGNGSFSGSTAFGTGVRISSIALGDIDNDGGLDLVVTGDSGSGYRLDKYINNGNGSFSGPTAFGTGVYRSSIVLGDIDNDSDLDLIVTGAGGFRLDKYINTNHTANAAPSMPADLTNIVSTNEYWKFEWSKSTDDYTSQNMLRYKIALGRTSGNYTYSSAVVDYPRGQANIGNVCIVTNPKYISEIYGGYKVYWKVCGFDSAFISSGYSSEKAAVPPIPDTPNILSADAVSTSRIDIVWNNVTIETAYKIYRNTSNNTNSLTEISIIGIDITNYSNTGLSPDTYYYYWIKSFNEGGESGYSAVSIVETMPSIPNIAEIEPIGSEYMSLKWNNIPNETSYTLYRNTSNNTNTAAKLTGATADITNYNDYSAEEGIKYYYWIKVYNSSGESGYSSVVSNILHPSVPALQADAVATNQINLVWNNIPNETAYTLFRNRNNNTNSGVKITGINPDITNYNDTGLTNGVTYFYWVKSYNISGGSGFSSVVSNIPSLPNTAEITEVKAVSDNQIQIKWNNIPNETSYTLYRNTENNTNTFVKVGGTDINVLEYTDTGLTKGIWYYYWIRAYNYSGKSGLSAYKKQIIDDTAPVITVSRNNSVFSGEVKITIEAEDAESGVEAVYYTTDGSNPLTSSTVTKIPGSSYELTLNKTTTVKCYAEDKAGLKSDVLSKEYEVLNVPEGDIAVYNNVLESDSGTPARIVINKTGEIEILIYNITGNLVKRYDKKKYTRGDIINWYGKYMDSNENLSSGIYLVVIKGDINKKFKVIIKRK